MKRDMDLVREILLVLEESEEPMFFRNKQGNIYSKLSNYELKQVWYHLVIMREAGLIRFYQTGHVYQVDENKWEEEELPGHLTWDGHEFLDAARNDTRWNKAKQIVLETGGGLMIDILKSVLTQLARQSIGLL